MESTTVKFENEFNSQIEKAMKKHHYTTKAEFIREALRDKLTSLQKQEYTMKALKLYGAGKKKHGKITDKDIHDARKRAARDLAQELGIDL